VKWKQRRISSRSAPRAGVSLSKRPRRVLVLCRLSRTTLSPERRGRGRGSSRSRSARDAARRRRRVPSALEKVRALRGPAFFRRVAVVQTVGPRRASPPRRRRSTKLSNSRTATARTPGRVEAPTAPESMNSRSASSSSSIRTICNSGARFRAGQAKSHCRFFG
jgi:hypothetical protein